MKHKFLLVGILSLLLGLTACNNNQEELKRLAAQLEEQNAKIENQSKTLSEQNQQLSEQNQQLSEQLEQLLQETQRIAGNVNGYKAVDLGLSVRWATCNVGARKPEEAGYYLQWGAIEETDNYAIPNVPFWDGENEVWTKYNDEDEKLTLDSEDDAASHYMGSLWRMPTIDEVQELLHQCDWKYAVLHNVPGVIITGPSGNSIFLPAVGYKDGESTYSEDEDGYYWTSSREEDPYSVFSFYFELDTSDEYIDGYSYSEDSRRYGQIVRAVCAY